MNELKLIIEQHELEPFSVVLKYSAFHYSEFDDNEYYSIEEIKITYEDLVTIVKDNNLAGYLSFRHEDNLIHNKTSKETEFFRWFDVMIYCQDGMIAVKRIFQNNEYLKSDIEYYRYENRLMNTESYSRLKRFIVDMTEFIDREANYYNPTSTEEELTMKNLFKRKKKSDDEPTEYTLNDESETPKDDKSASESTISKNFTKITNFNFKKMMNLTGKDK